MTFLPDLVPCKNDKLDFIFADIAGFNDTGGSLIELLNCFIDKQIFKAAKKVKILVLLTRTQIQDGRGMEARKQIEMLQRICSADLDCMIESVQPLLTKVKLGEPDIDIDTLRAALLEPHKIDIEVRM